MSPGLVLDAGGLIALERNDRRVQSLLARARETGATVVVPTTVLAQVVRAPVRQVSLMRLLRQPGTVTMPLDRASASFVGQLLGSSDTTDIADAHVVICARRTGHTVVTADGDDIRHLDPAVRLLEV